MIQADKAKSRYMAWNEDRTRCYLSDTKPTKSHGCPGEVQFKQRKSVLAKSTPIKASDIQTHCPGDACSNASDKKWCISDRSHQLWRCLNENGSGWCDSNDTNCTWRRVDETSCPGESCKNEEEGMFCNSSKSGYWYCKDNKWRKETHVTSKGGLPKKRERNNPGTSYQAGCAMTGLC